MSLFLYSDIHRLSLGISSITLLLFFSTLHSLFLVLLFTLYFMFIFTTSHIIAIIFIYLLSFYRIPIYTLQLIGSSLIFLLFYALPTLKILSLILNSVFLNDHLFTFLTLQRWSVKFLNINPYNIYLNRVLNGFSLHNLTISLQNHRLQIHFYFYFHIHYKLLELFHH